jgi:ferredoxin-thioredoxin reductase catalytic chain
MKNKKTFEEVQKFAAKVAEFRGWILNSDDEFLKYILEGHRENFNRLGYYACPCRETFDDREKDKDIICPCEYAEADIAEYGHCYCALFLSQEFSTSRKEAESIPERRPESRIP